MWMGSLAAPYWGGIRQIELREAVDGAAEVNGGGDHVNAFIDSSAADGLSAEDSAGGAIVDELQMHLFGTGVIAGVMHRMDVGGMGWHCPDRRLPPFGD
ncbi:MAG TPA: hypothetical protein VHP11_04700, partial [Tepidisphaeraceae bacterium]|nr:hypothetical protein [Tepidisphaeraceae bacterium]